MREALPYLVVLAVLWQLALFLELLAQTHTVSYVWTINLR